jgi:hypothetical protein
MGRETTKYEKLPKMILRILRLFESENPSPFPLSLSTLFTVEKL